jgi:hypothetical protein
MNRNQKIGIGCGAAGCLGLIVVGIAGAALYYWSSQRRPYEYRANRNFNFNTNANQNSSSSNTKESESTDSSSYSDDDKHKLFTAATFSQDSELILKTLKKIGLYKADGTPGPEYEEFVKEQVGWILQNMEFVNTVNSPEKGRAYVESHLKD